MFDDLELGFEELEFELVGQLEALLQKFLDFILGFTDGIEGFFNGLF